MIIMTKKNGFRKFLFWGYLLAGVSILILSQFLWDYFVGDRSVERNIFAIVALIIIIIMVILRFVTGQKIFKIFKHQLGV